MTTITDESAPLEVTTPYQYEVAHIQSRLAGESADHPRQKVIRWLTQFGYGDRVGQYNKLYAESVERHAQKELASKESYASYEAFGYLFGEPGYPGLDEQWELIVK